ncbi:lysoplasmalogenase [Chitinophagaceae bacterium LWZ2-11]
MELIKKRGIIIFWILLVVDCYFILSNDSQYRWGSKLLLMPVLTIYLFTNARKNYHRTYKLYIFLAMLFAWIGDALLLLKSEKAFLFGVGAFLLMHVMYILIFYKIKPLRLNKLPQEAVIATVVMLFGSIQLFKFINPELGSLKIPVVVYMVFIGIMAVLAANTLSSSGRKSLALGHFLPGAILFVISDSVLAIDKFRFNEPFLSVVVMLSYGYAQCLLMEGYTKMIKG